MTFGQFCELVKSRAFPEGLAENLDTLYTNRVQNCLVELQRLSPELQTCHLTSYDFGDTYYRFGTSIVPKPPGRVIEVYTHIADDKSDLAYYNEVPKHRLETFVLVENFEQPSPGISVTIDGGVLAAPNSGGVFRANSVYNKGWRAAEGFYAVETSPSGLSPGPSNLLLHPHVEEQEKIVVRWMGLKTAYTTEDALDYGQYQGRIEEIVEYYLRKEAAAKEDRSLSDFQLISADYLRKRSDLLVDLREDGPPQTTGTGVDTGETPTYIPIQDGNGVVWRIRIVTDAGVPQIEIQPNT